MKWVYWLPFVLGCAGSACSIFERNVDSYVDVPTTTGELESWAEEQGYTHEVGKLERDSSGGMRCGHTIACAILIPIIIANSVLPPLQKYGTAMDGDVPMYSGVFDLRGRLVKGWVRDGPDHHREIVRLDLDELGQHPIVERARVLLENGRPTSRETTLLQPQVDLIGMYDEALTDEGDADDRADLVVEELKVMGDEALESVLGRYAGLEEIEDDELARVIGQSCPDIQPELLAVGMDRGGSHTAHVAVRRCVLDDTQQAALAERVVLGACTASRADLQKYYDAIVKLGSLAAPHAGLCEVPRQTIVRYALGDRPTAEELTYVLVADRAADQFLERMRPSHAIDRQALFGAMGLSRDTAAIAKRLHEGTTGPLSVVEARRAAETYIGEIRGIQEWDARRHLLDLMLRSPAEVKQAAIAVFTEAPASRARGAALTALGEDVYAAEALDGLIMSSRQWAQHRNNLSTPSHRWYYTENVFIAYAMTRGACTEDMVEEARRVVRKGGTPAPCGSP